MTDPVPAISYATPSAAAGSPVVAGVWVTVAGLALVFFGGCFCLGILMLVGNAFSPIGGGRSERAVLMFVLYGAAITCSVAGAWVMTLGIRKLLNVGR